MIHWEEVAGISWSMYMKHVGVWSRNGSASKFASAGQFQNAVSFPSFIKHCVTVGFALSRR